jgi:hypothetical protein
LDVSDDRPWHLTEPIANREIRASRAGDRRRRRVVAAVADDGAMSTDGKPALEKVDYQCLLGVRSSITATWFGSGEPVEVVAGWYQRNLDGYAEQALNNWVRQQASGTDLVVVAAAGQWPEGTPAPGREWGDRFRTLVLESSMVRHTR